MRTADPCSRMKAMSPSGLAKTLSRNDSTIALGSCLDLLDIGAPAERLDRDHLQQMLDFLRQLAETIDQLGSKTVDVVFVLDLGESPVEGKPYRQVGDILLRNEQSGADGDLRRPSVGDRRRNSGLEAQHRLLQHLLVELEADFLDMA